MTSIEKAADVEKNRFYDYFKRSQELEDKLRGQIMELTSHLDGMRGQVQKNRNDLSKIFNTIRAQLNERETELKAKMSDRITDQEESIESKR